MKKETVLRYIASGLFCITAVLGLCTVITGKIDFSYIGLGYYGNLTLPLFTIAVPVLLAIALLLDRPILGVCGGILGAAFYLVRLISSLPSFLRNVQMTYMSYGVASVESLLCLLSFVFLTMTFAFMPGEKAKGPFRGFAIASSGLRFLALTVAFAFGCVMSVTAFKNISRFAFFYPQIKLTAMKCYRVTISGTMFLIQDVMSVLSLIMTAAAFRTDSGKN